MTRQNPFNAKFLPNHTPSAYEIWFAVIIDRASKKALWLRYSTLFPNENTSNKPIAVMWASLFDAQEPNNHFYTAETFPINSISLLGNNYSYPKGSFSLEKLSGSLTKGNLAWDLAYQHQFEAFDYVPCLIKNSPLKNFVKTHSASCSPFAKVNGTIKFNEMTYPINNASGVLTHIWGTNRVEKLFWIFTPIFDNDTEGWALEVASIRLKPFLPALTVVKLLHNGSLYYDSSLLSALSATVKVNYPELEVKNRCKDFKLWVKAKLNLEQITPYIYRNPDGKPRYIEQSDVGEAICIIEQKNKKLELATKTGAAVEFHGLSPWSNKTYLDPYNQK